MHSVRVTASEEIRQPVLLLFISSRGARAFRRCPGERPLNAQLPGTVGSVTPHRSSGRPQVESDGVSRGGTMQVMPLPEWCLGTVVVHRYDAVTCTTDTCPTDLSLETWFSHHTSFVTCRTDACPHCVIDPPVRLVHGDSNPISSSLLRRRSRGRLLESARRRHPSS